MLKEAWDEYDVEVVPDEAPHIQRQECRRAFYAGAHVMMQKILELADNNDPDMATITAEWEQECFEFKKAVEEGRA